MKIVNLELTTPEENLAGDEFLLDLCERRPGEDLLRFWESKQYFAVVGYSNRVSAVVNSTACADRRVPVLRRCSGGGAVMQGPGCLNYSLCLRINEASPLVGIPETNHFIMNTLRTALQPALSRPIEIAGYTDLVVDGRKFSGNAQRRRAGWLLFHGAFLLEFNLELIEACLRLPPSQPAYRAGRAHLEFLVNLHIPAELIRCLISNHFKVDGEFTIEDCAAIQELVRAKYSQADWNLRY
jgi:lipoate---protein ligase